MGGACLRSFGRCASNPQNRRRSQCKSILSQCRRIVSIESCKGAVARAVIHLSADTCDTLFPIEYTTSSVTEESAEFDEPAAEEPNSAEYVVGIATAALIVAIGAI